jgi:hypothetical protein
MKSLVFITLILVGSLSANFLPWKSTPTHARHLGGANDDCINAIKGGQLEAGGITLSNMKTGGGNQYEMKVYFNNDLTPCNGEKDGIETRVYMCNELNPEKRNDDCINSYPEASDNAATWKLIPESCKDPYKP